MAKRVARTAYCFASMQFKRCARFHSHVADTHADFAMFDGHNCLLGPEGLGFFYVRPDVMEQLSLSDFGWHMVEHLGDYSRKYWQPATTARRF